MSTIIWDIMETVEELEETMGENLTICEERNEEGITLTRETWNGLQRNRSCLTWIRR